jgi:hypothetical protein
MPQLPYTRITDLKWQVVLCGEGMTGWMRLLSNFLPWRKSGGAMARIYPIFAQGYTYKTAAHSYLAELKYLSSFKPRFFAGGSSFSRKRSKKR